MNIVLMICIIIVSEIISHEITSREITGIRNSVGQVGRNK